MPPDSLLEAAARLSGGVDLLSASGAAVAAGDPNAAAIRDAQAASVDLITDAARASDPNGLSRQVSQSLERVTAIGAAASVLETFVSSGQFLADHDSAEYATLADAVTAADIALQLRRIADAPTLTLLVNPNQMAITHTNIQDHSSKTRYGFSFERWGEDQPTISFSGSTGAFIAGMRGGLGEDPTAARVSRQTGGPSGVQFASKRDSAAWQNLVSLIHFFRSNGYVYDAAGGSDAHLFVGAIAIDYDQWTYVGHIESFDYSYDEGIPHRIEWSMEFKVDRLYDWAQSPSVVLPMTSPTASPTDPTYSGGSPRSRAAATRSSLAKTAADVGSTADPESKYGVIPLELLE
jgi:hypothetical protein